jgi:hypothetical protein
MSCNELRGRPTTSAACDRPSNTVEAASRATRETTRSERPKRRNVGAMLPAGAARLTRRGHALAAALVALALPTTEAAAQTTTESQMWASSTVTAKLGGAVAADHGLSAWLDLHARRGPDGFLGILRPAIGYRFSPAWSIWGGYAWVPFYDDEDASKDVSEHRAWQQAIGQARHDQLLLQFRPRFEQRFRDGEDVAFRLRLFGRANVDLWKEAPLAVAAWDETFVQLGETSWKAPGGFDQNRLFLGLAYTAGEVRIEPGYLNVTVRRADDSLRIEHNFALNAFFGF